MAHRLASGTPTKSPRYVLPGTPRRRLVAASFAGACVVLAVGAALFAGGARSVASPGRVAGPHAPIDVNCAQCHAGSSHRAVIDLRCERCHDPGGSERLTHAAHALLGSSGAPTAGHRAPLPCAVCHMDHRGRTVNLRAVDDRQCATCHVFGGFARHPEFAAVVARTAAGSGLKFNHDRHIVEVQKTSGTTCDGCHQPTATLSGFEPIAFDTHCASCHVRDGFLTNVEEGVPIAASLVVPPKQITEPWAAGVTIDMQPAGQGRLTIGRVRHRDPWVLYNALRLRRVIEPDAEALERAALTGHVTLLEQQLASGSLATLPRTDLALSAERLRADIADLDARLVAKPDPVRDAAALNQTLSDVRRFAGALAAVPAAAEEARALVRQLPASASAPPQPTLEPQSAAQFDQHKQQLLHLLDAIDRSIDARVRGKSAEFRQRALNLRPGASGERDMQSVRETKRRLLARVVQEIELQAAGETVGPSLAAPARDRAALTATLARVRQQVAALEGGGARPPVAATPAARESAVNALDALLTTCQTCHELTGARLAAVGTSSPLPRVKFTHAPHVIQTKCETCHDSIAKSKKATDVNVPTVATCQQCHTSSKVRADCSTCHAYHPRSVARLVTSR